MEIKKEFKHKVESLNDDNIKASIKKSYDMNSTNVENSVNALSGSLNAMLDDLNTHIHSITKNLNTYVKKSEENDQAQARKMKL